MCTTSDHTQWFDAAQTQLQQGDLWEQEIVPRLPTNLGEQAKTLGALQRRRGIKQASDLLRAILSWILCQRSLRQLGAWAVLLGLADLSEAAWRKRLAKCGDWLHWLVQEALRGSRGHEDGQNKTGRVLIVDGTRLLPPRSGKKGGWVVQLTYDVGAGALVDIRVGMPIWLKRSKEYPWLREMWCSTIAALPAALASLRSRASTPLNWVGGRRPAHGYSMRTEPR